MSKIDERQFGDAHDTDHIADYEHILREVSRLLERGGVDTSFWGTGDAKTLNHLVKEVMNGESKLIINQETGELERRVTVLAVDVLCEQDGKRLELVEDRQEFTDGRVRRRKLPQSLSEKMTTDENPDEAVSRALQEELGISGKLLGYYDIGMTESKKATDSYPGLTSVYNTHNRVAVISPNDFKPEGYVEEQADKSNYWVWREV